MEAEKQTNARVFDELSAHDSRIGQELLQQKVFKQTNSDSEHRIFHPSSNLKRLKKEHENGFSYLSVFIPINLPLMIIFP